MLLALLLCFSLASCGDPDRKDDPSSITDVPITETPPTELEFD